MVIVMVALSLAGAGPTAGAEQIAGTAAGANPQELTSPTQSPYGINDWNWTDVAMQAAKDAGIGWMRLQGVLWRNIEPVQGQLKWNSGPTSRIDDYMAQAARYGMKVTVPVSLAPDWAKQPGLELPRPEAYAGFVTTLLQRYPGQIAAVEILAEENTGTWPATKSRDAIYYVPVLRAAYQAVKAVSPDTLVVTSSLWGSPRGYLEDIYTLGGKGFFDVVNTHYYPGSNAPSLNFNGWITDLHNVMAKYGDGGKPIWVTEFAWTINDEQQSGAVSPKQQSEFMNYILTNSMKSGFVQRVFWYVLQDDDGMALMHATNLFGWHTPQPGLSGAVSPGETSLSVLGDWTKHWPTNGTLIVDGEQIDYASLSLTGTDTAVQGLVRGVNGTSAASHSAGVVVYNQALTAGFKRQGYYTYKSFITAHPTWGSPDVVQLPDVAPAASTAVTLANTGFEGGAAGWSGSFDIDNVERYSGAASARVTNAKGSPVRVFQGKQPVEPGKSYTSRGWVKIDQAGSGDMNAMVMVNLMDASGTYVADLPGNYYVYGTNGAWREIHYSFSTPANATQAQLFLSLNGGTGTAWFDDITLTPIAKVLPVLNPGFENGSSGWSGNSVVDITQSHSGAASARIVNDSGRAVNAYQVTRQPVVQGKTYLVSGWVKIDPKGSGRMNAMVMVNFLDASARYLSFVPGSSRLYGTGGNWQEIRYTFNAPPNASQMLVYISTSERTGTAWFDDITLISN